jgi:hypothetical protein
VSTMAVFLTPCASSGRVVTARAPQIAALRGRAALRLGARFATSVLPAAL